MKYKLETSGHFYSEDSHKKKLEEYGFTFRKHGYKDQVFEEELVLDTDTVEIEINTLEDIKKLVDTFDRIVVDKDTIEIYDDRRED